MGVRARSVAAAYRWACSEAIVARRSGSTPAKVPAAAADAPSASASSDAPRRRTASADGTGPGRAGGAVGAG